MSTCPVCRATDLRQFTALTTPYLDRSESYSILVCAVCGHGHAVGKDDDDYLRHIYSDDFHDTSQQSARSGNSPIEMNAAARSSWLRDIGCSGRLLDIGAGKGIFVKAASAMFDAEGIELSESAAAAAQAEGIAIAPGDFITMSPTPGFFDVITFWDVLASLKDPGAALDRAAQMLTPSGIVVLTLPMIDSLAARLLRKFWPLLIPPVNLQYFSQASIAMLAAQHGLKIDRMTFRPKRVALSFLMAKGARSIRMFSLGKILGERMPDWPIPINTGDIACVVLRRIEESQPS
ncbi:MAG TPA: class I SAM-dependent methyltransferase [Devosiaceae bacterium]|jgi:SAM-dependent methyltransferase